MPPKKYFILFLFFTLIYSHVENEHNLEEGDLGSFVSMKYGYQMSGIKSEDFVRSNYSPLFNITVGKWFTPYLAFQIGYKGFYFNTIADAVKHHYNYFYGEAVLNFNNAVYPNRINKSWNLLLHAGPGYFYNHVYGKPNICANIGLQNIYELTNQFQATFDISFIIGWDIYQGDEDILPGLTVGVTYFFIF
jgi:hypothetical protein